MSQEIHVLTQIHNGERIPVLCFEDYDGAIKRRNLYKKLSFLNKYKGSWEITAVTVPYRTDVVYVTQQKEHILGKEFMVEQFHTNPVSDYQYAVKVILKEPARVKIYQPYILAIILLLTATTVCSFFKMKVMTHMLFTSLVCLLYLGFLGEIIFLMKGVLKE